LQAAENALGLALVAMVGGTRPAVSPPMVAAYLLEHFDIRPGEAEVRRHDPEDFIVRFRRREDRDRVLAAPPGGMLLPLVWRPWRRTSMASAGTFRFRVLVGMTRVPLHARSTAMAQVFSLRLSRKRSSRPPSSAYALFSMVRISVLFAYAAPRSATSRSSGTKSWASVLTIIKLGFRYIELIRLQQQY
jgi:hypothetical protein